MHESLPSGDYRGYVFADNGHAVLGRGRHCVLKLATSTRYSKPRKVAIKVATSTQSSIEEAEILLKLNHEHIVEIYDFFLAEGRTYIVLELAEKGNLREYVRRQGRTAENLAGKWCRQIFDAVTYLHDIASVVHGDLKCENVLVDLREDLKITDFGLATDLANISTNSSSRYGDSTAGEASRNVNSSREFDFTDADDSDDDPRTTVAAWLGGSPAYSAPEVLDGTITDPTMADVWSAGVVAFFILTSYLPFGCHGIHSIRAAMERPLRWPRPLKQIKKSLRTFVQSALTLKENMRPRARELLDLVLAVS